jgi:broad specificity phosphatase PhoE
MRFSAIVASALLSTASVSAAQPSMVILVRHAERAAAPTGDPVLTEAGVQRALDLAAALADAKVGSIITTQFQRTQLTARPLAEARHMTPIIVNASGGAAHIDAVAAAVRARPAGEVVLVVGHSNTIPAIIAALGGPRLPDLCDAQYASLFVLRPEADGAAALVRSRYGVADAPDADRCTRTMR